MYNQKTFQSTSSIYKLSRTNKCSIKKYLFNASKSFTITQSIFKSKKSKKSKNNLFNGLDGMIIIIFQSEIYFSVKFKNKLFKNRMILIKSTVTHIKSLININWSLLNPLKILKIFFPSILTSQIYKKESLTLIIIYTNKSNNNNKNKDNDKVYGIMIKCFLRTIYIYFSINSWKTRI